MSFLFCFVLFKFELTVLDGDQPVVITSQRTVTNTITAPEDYLSILQPSEPQTTLFETNTYVELQLKMEWNVTRIQLIYKILFTGITIPWY